MRHIPSNESNNSNASPKARESDDFAFERIPRGIGEAEN